MQIIKKLSLNKTPKDIPNGSIVCAKNMMVDDTASFLTQDIGFKELNIQSGNIVGIIPTTHEIIVFTDHKDDHTNIYNVYRKDDSEDTFHRIKTTWKCPTFEEDEEYELTGSYTYNYKNELVLVVAEKSNKRNIPLKTFIVHENTDDDSDLYKYKAQDNQTYATDDVIPRYTVSYSIGRHGSLVCGNYTFFIRFVVDKDNYTKWFQITPDINIIQQVESKVYRHKYLASRDTYASDPVTGGPILVNNDVQSSKNIQLNIEIHDDFYKEFQIGFIIKKGSDVQGRIYGTYKSDESVVVDVVNNKFIEDLSLASILENPTNYYNVGIVNVYNNRLYIADYKEYPVEDYTDVVNNIAIESGTAALASTGEQSANEGSLEDEQILYNIRLTTRVDQYHKCSRAEYPNCSDVYNIYILTDENYKVLPDSKTAIMEKLKSSIALRDEEVNSLYTLDGRIKDAFQQYSTENTNINLYLILQKKNTPTDYLCIASFVPTSYNPNNYGWTWNFTVPDFDIYVTDTQIKIRYNSIDYILYDKNDEANRDVLGVLGFCRVDTFDSQYYWFSKTMPYIGGTNIPGARGINAGTALPTDEIRTFLNHSITNIEITGSSGGDTPIDEDGNKDGGVQGSAGPNSRTLIPHQVYNFFIHYVRPDGSCTPGYSIGTASFVNSNGNIIVPSFTNIRLPSAEFVGYFISYEEVERNVTCVLVTKDSSSGTFEVTNASYLYDVAGFKDLIGSKIVAKRVINNNTTEYEVQLSDINTKLLEDRLLHNRLRIITTAGNQIPEDTIAFIVRYISNQYNNRAKTLYRLTAIKYCQQNEVSDITDADYLPGYYSTQNIIRYEGDNHSLSDGLIVDPNAEYVYKVDKVNLNSTGTETTYDVAFKIVPMYSEYPSEAMNIKQDFMVVAKTYTVTDTTSTDPDAKRNDLLINIVLPPDRLHDFLEIQQAYNTVPVKPYTNFREDSVSEFPKTIKRSDVSSDESLINGFRHFAPDNYKNILENKGKITNVVGIGLYLLVHTEYSMFVFDRSPKLTKVSQLEIPDTFDIDYQEVLPSDEGFGGLRNKHEAIITKNGYIWYDFNNKIIFKYENGSAEIISTDINNYIKHLNITSVRFAEDIIHNRLIICFNLADGFITLSYNFNTKTFISAHDYKFTDNFRTYNKSYLIDKTHNTNTIYEFTDVHNADYKGLFSVNRNYFPCYDIVEDNVSIRSNSYVDVIYNDLFVSSKMLESISYTLSKIVNERYVYNIVEEELNRKYSGFQLLLYTDETNSGLLDINIGDNFNLYNNYKYPVFNKGAWTLNYFRNKIHDVIAEDPLRPQQSPISQSDQKSLIYGKYIVARFIFDHSDLTIFKPVKLDSITFNTHLY